MTKNQDFFVIPTSAKFPDFISSTAVELLMQSPYTFYVKNILKLKRLDRFKSSPNLADFGIFIHHVLDQYTRGYCARSFREQLAIFFSIAKTSLEKMHFQKQDFWMHKIECIAEEFIDFDEDRRANIVKIWSEQKGSTLIQLAERNITLTSIADRIELYKNGELCILDYKTGVIPSNQDVKMGLSPQLLISSIIASKGGFDCLERIGIPHKVTYVKLASCSPYWHVSDIIVDNLDDHLKQLVHLLELFVNSGTELKFVPMEKANNGYDEYLHLGRVFAHYNV